MTESPALRVRHLTVTVGGHPPAVPVFDVSLTIGEAEIVGLVGESGCGKTMTALAIADLLPVGAHLSAESMAINGQELLSMPRGRKAKVLGQGLAVVFQDPSAALNPVRRVGRQLVEASRHHRKLSRTAASLEAQDRLREVRIAAPARRMAEYPDSFSGGMRQRAVIAMGLMNRPALLIADEPTTALDVTVQADVIEVLRSINSTDGVAILFVSHNIALVADVCDRVLVMYGGTIVEELPADSLLEGSRHPYTAALIRSVPSLETPRDQPLATIPGSPPDPREPHVGCPFAARCELAMERCVTERPPLTRLDHLHRCACWVTAPPEVGHAPD